MTFTKEFLHLRLKEKERMWCGQGLKFVEWTEKGSAVDCPFCLANWGRHLAARAERGESFSVEDGAAFVRAVGSVRERLDKEKKSSQLR